MSADAVLVVADTLRKHQWRGNFLGCGCGWSWPEELTHFCGEDERIAKAHASHVAAAVVDALGGLERETRFKYTHLGTGRWTILESTDVQVARKIAGTTHELTEVSRWVSGWVREPAEERKP